MAVAPRYTWVMPTGRPDESDSLTEAVTSLADELAKEPIIAAPRWLAERVANGSGSDAAKECVNSE